MKDINNSIYVKVTALCILITYTLQIVNSYYQIFGKASSRIAVETSVCNCYLMINHHDLILTILDNQ